jgi:hypothetical protein
LFPLGLGNQEAIPHITEELNLHDVDLGDRDARHIGPSLVRIGVIIQEFVAKHEGHCE